MIKYVCPKCNHTTDDVRDSIDPRTEPCSSCRAKLAKEFPAGSRWRGRITGATVLVYGEAGGIVSYRTARNDRPIAMPSHKFRATFERIEHPEAPKCPRCNGSGCEPAPRGATPLEPTLCLDCEGRCR